MDDKITALLISNAFSFALFVASEVIGSYKCKSNSVYELIKIQFKPKERNVLNVSVEETVTEPAVPLAGAPTGNPLETPLTNPIPLGTPSPPNYKAGINVIVN